VLRVLQECVSVSLVDPQYIRTYILPEFLKQFWVRRMVMEKENCKQLIGTTLQMAKRVGAVEVVGHLVEGLRDESGPFRKIVVEALDVIIGSLRLRDEFGTTAKIDARLEACLT